MKPPVFHPEAEEELRQALAYYQQRAGLGAALRREVDACIARIQENPLAYAVYDDRCTRLSIVRRFPYSIYYAERADDIWIVAVAHHKRRPDYWRRRIDS